MLGSHVRTASMPYGALPFNSGIHGCASQRNEENSRSLRRLLLLVKRLQCPLLGGSELRLGDAELEEPRGDGGEAVGRIR